MNKLRKLRLEKKLSTRQLEILSGVARHTITRIERGGTKMQAKTMFKLATALGVKISEVIPDD